MFTLTVIHFWGTTILYYTTAHNGKGKETKKSVFSKGLQHLHLFSYSTVVLLRSSVPLPASAKKHSSIAIYPSWPSRSQGWSQLTGLPLMWSILYEPGLDQLTKKPWKNPTLPKKVESLISWGKKAYRIWKLMLFSLKFLSIFTTRFDFFRFSSRLSGGWKKFGKEFPVHLGVSKK